MCKHTWPIKLILIRLDQNIRSLGWHSIFNFEYRISIFFFFFNNWHPPRNGSQLVHLVEHLQQTVRQWKTHAYISWKIFYYEHACRTSTSEIMNLSAQKTQHVNGPSATTKPNAMHAFSFCQLSRDASESLGSACSSSCSADEMRWCEAALRDWKREDAV